MLSQALRVHRKHVFDWLACANLRWFQGAPQSLDEIAVGFGRRSTLFARGKVISRQFCACQKV
jgi:hypothetical protein